MDYLDEINQRKQRMTAESFDMAERQGIGGGGHNGKQDAFRHAYISAKTTRDQNYLYAQATGTAVELKNEFDSRRENWKEDKLSAITKRGNPSAEWHMDELNNLVGREIGKKAKEEGWSDERLAQEIKKALEQGRLVEAPREPDPRIITPTRPNGLMANETITTSPSILDYYLSRQQEQPSEEEENINLWERILGR